MGWYCYPENLLEELIKKKLKPKEIVRITIPSSDEDQNQTDP